MNHRFFIVLVAVVIAPGLTLAQSGNTDMPLRTPDGQPDISGILRFGR